MAEIKVQLCGISTQVYRQTRKTTTAEFLVEWPSGSFRLKAQATYPLFSGPAKSDKGVAKEVWNRLIQDLPKVAKDLGRVEPNWCPIHPQVDTYS